MADNLISIEQAENDLLSAAAYLAERVKSREGHAEAVAAVLPHYLKRGDVDLAAALVDAIDDPYSRDRMLIPVAEKCAQLDDDEYALQLAEAVEDVGLQSQAIERIALQKAAKGEFEKAREIAARLAHPDAVLAGIAVNQSALGDDGAADRTLAEITFRGTTAAAIIEIASAKIEAGKGEEAIPFLETAVSESGSIEHNEERIRVLTDIGNLFNQAGRSDRAIEVLGTARGEAEVLDNVHRDGFLGNMALGFLRAGNLELADRTLDLVADKTQMAAALLGYSREFWNKDERSEALEALEESYAVLKSQHESETRSSREKFGLFTSIAAQFAGFEKGERAIEIAQEIADENEQMSALSQIAQISAIQENETVARQAINAIQRDDFRVSALIGLSDAGAKKGDNAGAVEILNEALVLAETVPQLISRSDEYNAIAKRFHDLGETAGANDAAKRSLETIAEIRDEAAKAVAVASLAVLYDETGLPLSADAGELFRGLLVARHA